MCRSVFIIDAVIFQSLTPARILLRLPVAAGRHSAMAHLDRGVDVGEASGQIRQGLEEFGRHTSLGPATVRRSSNF